MTNIEFLSTMYILVQKKSRFVNEYKYGLETRRMTKKVLKIENFFYMCGPCSDCKTFA